MMRSLLFILNAMFDFLFKKRFKSKSSEVTKLQPKAPFQVQPSVQAAKDADKFGQVQSKKQAELVEVESLAGQEQAAMAFILRSQHPDARVQAVMHIHSPEALRQVAEAMRNKDRRVSKLAQEKLTKLQNKQKMDLMIQVCLEQGRQLLGNIPLMANQFAEWDKQRLALGQDGLSLLQIKAQLEQQLQAQLELQRQAMQVIKGLCSIMSVDLLDPAQVQLNEGLQQWQSIQSNVLSASLPKHLVDQLNRNLIAAQLHIDQLVQNNQKKNPISQVTLTTPQHILDVNGEHKPPIPAPKPAQIATVDITSILVELEQALEQGSLQQALALDKTIKSSLISADKEVLQRLRTVRIELRRLLSWAKWGGAISREELLKVAQSLLVYNVTDQKSALELAKKVGGLRARWKELDRTSGSAAAETMWMQFNETCNRAYQSADAYFKQQAQTRLDNLSLAQAQLARIDEAIANEKSHLPDWKTRQTYLQRARTEWRKLGVIDRKVKIRLDTEFDQKMAMLVEPLTAARQAATEQRKQLIHSVQAIDPVGRNAIEKVRQMQRKWQQEALKIPLLRKEEQALWHQFRTACDAVFEQRKVHGEQQQQRRQQIKTELTHLCAKIKLCARIEAVNPTNEPELESRSAAWRTEWKSLSTGLLPPELNKRLAQRFDHGLAAFSAQKNANG